MARLGELCANEEGDNLRAEGAWLIGKLCEGTSANLEEFAPSILTHLLTMYASPDAEIQKAALGALR